VPIRFEAIAALGHLGDESVIGLLTEKLNDHEMNAVLWPDENLISEAAKQALMTIRNHLAV
jgi:hypothetical protein